MSARPDSPRDARVGRSWNKKGVGPLRRSHGDDRTGFMPRKPPEAPVTHRLPGFGMQNNGHAIASRTLASGVTRMGHQPCAPVGARPHAPCPPQHGDNSGVRSRSSTTVERCRAVAKPRSAASIATLATSQSHSNPPCARKRNTCTLKAAGLQLDLARRSPFTGGVVIRRPHQAC
jgi:hypothetical protein